jgi:hypothetical protein
LKQNYRCHSCDLTTTYISKDGRYFWYLNRDIHSPWIVLHVVCKYCYDHVLRNPKQFNTREEYIEFRRSVRRGKSPPNKGIRLQYNRECYCCGSTTTHVDKTGRRHWMLNHDPENNVLCNKCKMHLFFNPKRKPEYYITFKNKKIYLSYNPRTGFCSQCGKAGDTQMHHEQYDESNPLAHIVELCISCHGRISQKNTVYVRKS